MCEFVQRSPLIFLSTIDQRGLADVLPKGDGPGFVKFSTDGDLLIPDRPGNKLIMGFENILRNQNVGIIFVILNTRETLRVKGTAKLSNDPELLDQLSAKGKPALLCTKVTVTECFFHCGKAMIRSGVWKPETWQNRDKSLMIKSIAQKFSQQENHVEKSLEESYRDKLY
ncbi:MAG: PPOX class probable FMN-dependent enzyme [Cryomorphaceae bacterium]|jgi:PPOX class probable FMN-dependent enzyme